MKSCILFKNKIKGKLGLLEILDFLWEMDNVNFQLIFQQSWVLGH